MHPYRFCAQAEGLLFQRLRQSRSHAPALEVLPHVKAVQIIRWGQVCKTGDSSLRLSHQRHMGPQAPIPGPGVQLFRRRRPGIPLLPRIFPRADLPHCLMKEPQQLRQIFAAVGPQRDFLHHHPYRPFPGRQPNHTLRFSTVIAA